MLYGCLNRPVLKPRLFFSRFFEFESPYGISLENPGSSRGASLCEGAEQEKMPAEGGGPLLLSPEGRENNLVTFADWELRGVHRKDSLFRLWKNHLLFTRNFLSGCGPGFSIEGTIDWVLNEHPNEGKHNCVENCCCVCVTPWG